MPGATPRARRSAARLSRVRGVGVLAIRSASDIAFSFFYPLPDAERYLVGAAWKADLPLPAKMPGKR
jgi:hypothetical protein